MTHKNNPRLVLRKPHAVAIMISAWLVAAVVLRPVEPLATDAMQVAMAAVVLASSAFGGLFRGAKRRKGDRPRPPARVWAFVLAGPVVCVATAILASAGDLGSIVIPALLGVLGGFAFGPALAIAITTSRVLNGEDPGR